MRLALQDMPLNFVLYTKGSGGDIFPFIRVGEELKNRGHQVTLMTHCGYEARAKTSSLDFVALDSPQEYEKFLGDQELLNSPRGIPDFLRHHSLSRALGDYRLVSQQCKGDNSIIVTRDLFDLVPRLAAEKLRLPLRWMFGNPSQVATWSLREQLFSQLLRSEINGVRFALGLPSTPLTNCELGYASLGVALWPEWFAEPNQNYPIPIAPVGFIREADAPGVEIPPTIERVLNCGKPTVLISAGTGMYLRSEFYDVATKACELVDCAGIAVTQHSDQLPEDRRSCVSWVGILPFRKLMQQVRLIIHHGGLGTLACAMEAGIPQLVLPKGADRPDNAARLQTLGVAESLPPPKWQPELIAKSLTRLLGSPMVAKKCRTLADRLKDQDGTQAACQVIEQLGPP